MPNSAVIPKNRASVLLVDDFSDAGPTADILTAGGNAQVDVAGDFSSALQALTNRVPDVLITEARLGEYHGLHLVLRLRAIDPTAVAIVLTSFPDPVLQRDADGLGAVYMVKPVEPSALFEAVASGLRGRLSAPAHTPPTSSELDLGSRRV